MKKLLIGLTLLTSLPSIASADILGRYEGISAHQKKCFLELSELRYGPDEIHVSTEMKVSFAKKIFKKKKFEFSMNKRSFNEEVEKGYISSTNISDDVVTDHYNIEDLGIILSADGVVEELSVTVKDERAGRDPITREGTCTNLVKKD